MATVHPSRMGMVKDAHVAKPPPPSREEELRQKLLERRKEKGSTNGHHEVEEISIRGRGGEQRNGSSSRYRDHDTDDRSRGSKNGDSVEPRRVRGHDSPVSRYEDERRQSRRRSPSPPQDDDRSSRRYENDRDRANYDDRRRDGDYDGYRESRRRKDEREYEERKNRNSPGRSRYRDDREDRNVHDDRSRRPSPSYRPYDRPPPPAASNGDTGHSNGVSDAYGYGPNRADMGFQAVGGPWPPPPGAASNGNGPGYGGPMRMGFDRPPRGSPRGGGGGWMNPSELEQRRQERENMELSVWPPSPKHPYKDDEEHEAERRAKRKSKKSKSKSKSKRRSKYSDTETDTDSEEERERRRRRRRKEKERERERRKRYSESVDVSEDDRVDRKRSRRDRSVSRSASRRDDSREGDGDDQWIEKGADVEKEKTITSPTQQIAVRPVDDDDDDDEEVGPQLPIEHKDRISRAAYSHMLKGEGEAMAAFAAEGKRIPRRGEIGLDSQTIESYESSGYVMSGSRHARMNAVRLRKENQVINAEEKRAILKLQREERQKKEGAIIGQFREMLDDRLVHVQNQQNK